MLVKALLLSLGVLALAGTAACSTYNGGPPGHYRPISSLALELPATQYAGEPPQWSVKITGGQSGVNLIADWAFSSGVSPAHGQTLLNSYGGSPLLFAANCQIGEPPNGQPQTATLTVVVHDTKQRTYETTATVTFLPGRRPSTASAWRWSAWTARRPGCG
jgi:hypothetical protein